MPRIAWRLLTGTMVLAAVVTLAVVYHRHTRGWVPYQEPPVAGTQESWVGRLMLGEEPVETRFAGLFQYFATGFARHALPSYARVYYKGAASQNGLAVDGLEGFSRTAPLLAAWVYSGRGTRLPAAGQEPPLDVVEILRSGILTGVDPRSRDYWGHPQPQSQRIVEAADVARVLWLTRSLIWSRLSGAEQQRVRAWLQSAADQPTPRTNWMLFPVVINLTLANLEGEPDPARRRARAHEIFSQYRQLYLDHGWFNDPPHGVDYYNTWGIPYDLFWIHTLDPGFESQFIPAALRQSADLTQHLIGPRGIPILGRSVCYRTAVPVPLIAATFLSPEGFPEGKALHALDVVWQYFVARDSLRDGALTQGYFGADLRLLDVYSGTGSCHWGLRSLVLAFMHPANDAFWQARQQPLPVETSDYRLELSRLGWIVEGRQASGDIRITVLKNNGRVTRIEDYSWEMKLAESLLGKPMRPHNSEVKYESRYYSSTAPFPLLE